MKEQELRRQLDEISREAFPDSLRPSPTFRERLQVRADKPSKRGFITIARVAAIMVVALLFVSGFFLITPQGHALAQEILQFFTRSESDALPLLSRQLTPRPTPAPGTRTPDPASLIDALQAVGDVEQLAGYKILLPSWLPDVLSFAGASYQADQHIVRIFYRYEGTNGLGLKQEPIQKTEDCELCDKVGASALVETVQIGSVSGEYVEGVWKLTEKGPVWESDPWLKTLRWQANHMAFELRYMGPPDSVSKADLIAIAQSIK